MLFDNLIYNTSPIIVHAPGMRFHPDLEQLFHHLCSVLFAEEPRSLGNPPDTAIVTWNTSDNTSVLQKCLQLLGIRYYEIKGDPQQWTNYQKFTKLGKALDHIKQRFVIGLDAFDVLVLDDLRPLVKWFGQQDQAGIIFNGEKTFWPHLGPLHSAYGFEKQVVPDEACFLNSGVFIARTDFLRERFMPEYTAVNWRQLFPTQEFFEEQVRLRYGTDALELQSVKADTDDQLVCHLVYKKLYPQVQVDSKNCFMQVIKGWAYEAFRIRPATVRPK